MKKALLGLFLFTSFATFAQEDIQQEKVKHSEIKVNAFNLILFKSVDFSYEYLIDSESSVGASILFNLRDIDSGEDIFYNEKFAFTPYYRRYFSSKYAWGFFLEAFGMYNVQDEKVNDYIYNSIDNQYSNVSSNETSNNFAFGMAVGGKFVSKKGFLFEVFGGIGRNIATSNEKAATDLVPRLGTSFGWRF